MNLCGYIKPTLQRQLFSSRGGVKVTPYACYAKFWSIKVIPARLADRRAKHYGIHQARGLKGSHTYSFRAVLELMSLSA